MNSSDLIDLNLTDHLNSTFNPDNSIYSHELIIFIKKLCEVFKHVDKILMFSTVLFGVITNILCIIVFARPNFKKTNMGSFYINISVWNIIFLLFYMLVMDSQQTFNYNVALFNDAVCKFAVFFTRVVRELPPWIETYITVDRYLDICHPSKFSKLRDKNYITPTCLGFFVILSIISIENFWYYIRNHVDPSGISTTDLGFEPFKNKFISKCTTEKMNAVFSDTVSVLFRSIIPEFTICVFSILIVKTVLKSKKKISGSTLPNINNNIDKKNATKSREKTFTNTVIKMNIMLLVLNTPVTIMIILISLFSSDTNVVDDAVILNIYLVTYNISNLYYSLRFVFNLAFNKLFQDELFLMFNLKQSNKFSTNTSNRPVYNLREPTIMAK